MPPSHYPDHFVVDGSNIATEGRSMPSLAQLNEAVLAFAADHPEALLTVVVDATFGHRIDKSEVAEFDEAVANNELVAPPAGAVGRGDAFVLTIADKAGAGVLSNDSFQEFHGQYDWLFDEGRLVGGKPVPHVGWVFVDRTPVRGPKSRQSVKDAKSGKRRATKKVAASPAEAVAAKEQAKARIRPKSQSDEKSVEDSTESTARRGRSRAKKSGGTSRDQAESTQPTATEAPLRDGFVNDLMPFLDFVGNHAVGSTCQGVIENYASHGAYARVEDVAVYLPLRLMGDPPPRSARSVVKVGTPVTVEIVGFVPDRRSIDASLVSASPIDDEAVSGPGSERAEPDEAAAGQPMSTNDSPADTPIAVSPPASPDGSDAGARPRAAKKRAAKRGAVKKSAAGKRAATTRSPAESTADKSVAATAAATSKATATKAAAKKKPAAAKKAAVKKAAAKKAGAKKKPAAKKKAAARSTTHKSSVAKPAAKNSAAPKKSARPGKTASEGTGRRSASSTGQENS